MRGSNCIHIASACQVRRDVGCCIRYFQLPEATAAGRFLLPVFLIFLGFFFWLFLRGRPQQQTRTKASAQATSLAFAARHKQRGGLYDRSRDNLGVLPSL
jgi:hypothetical protein